MLNIKLNYNQQPTEKVSQIVHNEEYGRLVNILQKKKHERTHKDLEFLIKIFKDVKFFESFKDKLKPDQFTRIVESIEFLKSKKNQIVFRQGQKGHSFYIILKGSVHIIHNKKANEVKNVNTRQKSKLKALLDEYQSNKIASTSRLFDANTSLTPSNVAPKTTYGLQFGNT